MLVNNVEYNLARMSPSEKRQAIERMSPRERLSCVRRIYITFPRLQTIFDRIEYIHQEAFDLPEDAEPENNLLLTGLHGVGKTRLINRYKKRFPRKSVRKETKLGTVSVTHVPVLVATIPHRATDKAVVTELLVELGDPDAGDGSAVEQTLRLFNLIGECCVELIILDDFQHIIDADSDRVLMNVANFLKRILKKTKKPLILVGRPKSVRILNDNPQFNRLFSKRITIEPLKWKNSPSNKCELKSFLQYTDDSLPFSESSKLSSHDTAYKIFTATGGFLYRVMKLVRKAAEFAISLGKEAITEEDLYRAFIDQLQDEDKDEDKRVKNPFLSNSPRSAGTPKTTVRSDQGGTNRRVKATEERLTASRILGRG